MAQNIDGNLLDTMSLHGFDITMNAIQSNCASEASLCLHDGIIATHITSEKSQKCC